MIALLEGEVADVLDDSLIIRVSGVGFQVFVTREVREQYRVGEEICLYTYLVVREDSLSLYGFLSAVEKSFFSLLLGVNGVGPRLALTILSTLSVDAIRRAVIAEQAEVFNRVSGIGKKTAQKILLHLQGQVGQDEAVIGISGVDADMEVMEALTSLGYSVIEAQSAIQALPKDAPQDVEERLRLALQYFSG